MKNRRATGTTTATATTPVGRVCPFASRPLVGPPARSPAHGPLRAKARRVWDLGRGLCRLPPVRARARTTGRGPGRARASLALVANTAGPSCYTAPGRLDDHPPRRRRPLFEDDWRPNALAFAAGLCEARRARCGRRGAGSRRAPRETSLDTPLSLSLTLSRTRESEYRQFRYTCFC